MISLIFSAALVSGATGLVKEALPKGDDQLVRNLLTKYKSEGPIEIKLRKRLKSLFIAQEKVSEGVLKIKNEKLRLEIVKPEPSLMVVDGQSIWLEQTAENFEGETIFNVTKFPLTDEAKSSAILSILFSQESQLSAFQFLKATGTPEQRAYLYRPRLSQAETTDLQIVIHEGEGRILSLSYTDESENTITYDFGVTRFKAKISDKAFQYAPPKGVKVVEPMAPQDSQKGKRNSGKAPESLEKRKAQNENAKNKRYTIAESSAVDSRSFE